MAIFNAQGVLEAPPKAASPLNDRRVEQVIERMFDGYRRRANGGPRSSTLRDPHGLR
jgi:hypothetical protein